MSISGLLLKNIKKPLRITDSAVSGLVSISDGENSKEAHTSRTSFVSINARRLAICSSSSKNTRKAKGKPFSASFFKSPASGKTAVSVFGFGDGSAPAESEIFFRKLLISCSKVPISVVSGCPARTFSTSAFRKSPERNIRSIRSSIYSCLIPFSLTNENKSSIL